MSDKYIGETFRSTDSRTTNRRIRVTSLKPTDDARKHYRARVVTDDGNPKAVGRSVTLLAKTLDEHYEKVSH